MKKIYAVLFTMSFSLMTLGLTAQTQLNGSQKEGLMQYFPAELKQIQQRYNDDAQFSAAFTNYYKTIFTADRKAYNKLVIQNKLTATQAKAYITQFDFKYDSMHAMFSSMVAQQPALLVQYSQKQQTKQALSTCYPTDSNMNFAKGTLSGWNAYWAQNTSLPTNFAITDITGGLCSAITGAANDPQTNPAGIGPDYQVLLVSKQVDSLEPSIPVVPIGNSYAARLGDSTNPDLGVSILTQSFMVTPANENFKYSYSLFLENPYIGHAYYERPYFQFAVLNSSGDTIPGTKTILTSSDLQKLGYDSVFYGLNGDYVYYTGWQQAGVSLAAYAGQCITITAAVNDCSQSAHFGYGYFSFSKDSTLITSSSPTICGTHPVSLTAPSNTHYLWSGPVGAIIGSDTLRTIKVNMPGKYSAITTNSKAVSDTFFYTLNTGTRPATVNTTKYYCSTQAGTATALPFGTSPFTYTWSTGQTSSSVSGLAAGTYSFKATDSAGCTSVDTFAITAAPAIKIQDSASIRVLEPGDSIQLFAKVTGSDSTFIYSWAPAASVTNPNSAKTYAHPTTTTVYTVTATWGCGTVTDTITIFKRCTVTTTVSSTYHCYDGRTVTTAVTANGVPPFTYKWSNSVTTQSDSAYVAPGLVYYYLVVLDSNKCKDSLGYSVNQPNKLKVASTYALPPSCHNLCNGQIGISLSGGLAPYTYQWSKGASGTYIATGLCPGSYTVTATDQNGCQVDTFATVTNPAYYKINITDSVTPASCNTFHNVYLKASGGVTPYVYYWDGQNSGAILGTVKAGVYTVTVRDNNTCYDTAIFNVTGGPLNANIGFSNTNSIVCLGVPLVLTANVFGGCGVYKYRWSSYGGGGAFVPNDSAKSVTIIPKASAVFYLNATDTTGCAMVAAVTGSITTDPPVRVTITGIDTIIPGDSVRLTATGISGAGYGYKYTWQPGGSTAGTLRTTLNSNQVFTVTANDGCLLSGGKDSVKVIVDTLTKINICGNDPTTLKVSTKAKAYAWSGPGIIDSTTTQSITVNKAGTYSVIVTNPSGTPVIDTIYYILTQVSPAAKVLSTPYYCNGAAAIAIAKPAGVGPFTYTWSTGQTTDTIKNLTAGSYTLTAADGYGCTSVDTFLIPTATVALSITRSNYQVEAGDSVLLKVTSPGANSSTTYSWAPAASLTQPDSASTYAHPTVQTTYTVTVSSPCGPLTDTIVIYNGCTLTGTVTTKYNCVTVGTVSASNGVAPYKYRWFDGGTATKDSGFVDIQNQWHVIITDAAGCKDSVQFYPSYTNPFALTPDTGVSIACPQTCNGSLSVTITGGTYPFTYLWSTGATASPIAGLCAGTYWVKVTDAHGCKAQVTETIKGIDDSINATDTVTNGTCATLSSACITATGGTAPYDYGSTTQNCFTNLSAGKNSVVITDAKGCKYTYNYYITGGGAITATLTPSNTTICYGTATTITSIVTGGVGVYNYQWSTGSGILAKDTTASITVSPTVTTAYTLKVSDTAGCTIAGPPTAQVNVDAKLTVGITGNDTIKPGANTTLTATANGGTGTYNYVWQPGGSTAGSITATLSKSQEYTITVSDGCTIPNGMDSIFVFVDTNFNGLYIDSLIKGGCNNSIWVADSGTTSLSQFSFVWSTGATTDTISGLCAGTYTVVVTDNKPIMPHHNPSINRKITIVDPTGINAIQNNGLFSVYPVPATNKLTVTIANNGFKLQQAAVCDITGREIFMQNVNLKKNTMTIDVSQLDNGVYILMLTDGNTRKQARFIVTR